MGEKVKGVEGVKRCTEPAAQNSVTPFLSLVSATTAPRSDGGQLAGSLRKDSGICHRRGESSTNNPQIPPPRSRYTWFLKSVLLSQP